ncbi:hypothetical protein B484DRAFT_460845 [Ochromonadaceae sp. CCMP2298]|nr:hypothetical protein B484DRAFT_460845 [Ochromonadaceae sp. CCMP2298]
MFKFTKFDHQPSDYEIITARHEAGMFYKVIQSVDGKPEDVMNHVLKGIKHLGMWTVIALQDRVREDLEDVNMKGYEGLSKTTLDKLHAIVKTPVVKTPVVNGNRPFTLDAMEEFNNNFDREEDYFDNDGYVGTLADDTPDQDTDETYEPTDSDETHETVNSPGDSAYSKDPTGSDTTLSDSTVYTKDTISSESESTINTKTTDDTGYTETTDDTGYTETKIESDDPTINSHGTSDTPLWYKVDPNAVLGKNPLDSDDDPITTDGSPMVVDDIPMVGDEIDELVSRARYLIVSSFKEHDPNMRMEPSDSDDSD